MRHLAGAATLAIGGVERQVIVRTIAQARLARALRPDAVVLDLGMPGLDGLAVTCGIRRGGDTPAIVILTGREDPALAEAALAAGALGYVAKARAATELVPAVGAALGGHRFVPASARRAT